MKMWLVVGDGDEVEDEDARCVGEIQGWLDQLPSRSRGLGATDQRRQLPGTSTTSMPYLPLQQQFISHDNDTVSYFEHL